MRQFVADFETTTSADDCRVWAFAICDIENRNEVIIGTTLDEFMEWCKKQPDNIKVFFHNLKFDSQFLINWLFLHGFKHVTAKERASETFTTSISNKGLFYMIEVIYYLKGKKIKKVTFQDSLKLIPLSVADIAKAFKLPIQKSKIDYDAHNSQPIGAPLTAQEKEYITRDVQIVAHAINFFHSQGLDRITIGSCALNEYKNLIGKNVFARYFPTPRYHSDVEQSYKGGYVYLMPEFASKKLGRGIVLDKNSMFPWVMREKLLPWGTPIFFKGQYQYDEAFPLYIQMFKCQFELKPGKLPTVQIKKSIFYSGTEYLTSSNYAEITLCMTNIDLELFLEHYDVYNMKYLSGWKFRGTRGLFNAYIDKWNAVKIESRANDNPGMALIAKLFLNSLYGKFGTSNRKIEKIPYLGDDGAIHYKDTQPEPKDGIYIAMASFITSYARAEMVGAAQTIEDNYHAGKSKIRFVYCDTDSLHCISEDYSLPEGLHIDKYELGAWKFESKFTSAKYLRSKCYIERSTEEVTSENPKFALKVTVAGMPEECREQVNFKNFKIGATYHGKKQPKAVKGGVILQDIDFTIKKG